MFRQVVSGALRTNLPNILIPMQNRLPFYLQAPHIAKTEQTFTISLVFSIQFSFDRQHACLTESAVENLTGQDGIRIADVPGLHMQIPSVQFTEFPMQNGSQDIRLSVTMQNAICISTKQ
ncbi:hypothetical protein CBL_08158 [Carabus blaptoides fortunei]